MNLKAFVKSYEQHASSLRAVLDDWATMESDDRLEEVEELKRLLVTREAVLEDLREKGGSNSTLLILAIISADVELRGLDDAVYRSMGMRPTSFFTPTDTTVRRSSLTASQAPGLPIYPSVAL